MYKTDSADNLLGILQDMKKYKDIYEDDITVSEELSVIPHFEKTIKEIKDFIEYVNTYVVDYTDM